MQVHLPLQQGTGGQGVTDRYGIPYDEDTGQSRDVLDGSHRADSFRFLGLLGDQGSACQAGHQDEGDYLFHGEQVGRKAAAGKRVLPFARTSRLGSSRSFGFDHPHRLSETHPMKPYAPCLLLALACFAPGVSADPGDDALKEYFELETAKIEAGFLSDVKNKADWLAKKDTYRKQLFHMLGLSPNRERTDLKATITGKVEGEGFVVEKLHYQSSPGLYVTGNLYLPADRKPNQKFPAILYVCGHGRVKKDGISYGNKVHYHHHGSWFARHGYVCLTIDTIQLGEIEGLHHGIYSKNMWWWASRGYTPAGVEAWNGIRGIDYLQSRPEVERVMYPGLPSDPGHALWQRDFLGASGLLSFTLTQEYAPFRSAFIDRLGLFALGGSWGGFESLVMPVDPIRTATDYVTPGAAVRLHVGLEDHEDLFADLEKAFSALQQ